MSIMCPLKLDNGKTWYVGSGCVTPVWMQREGDVPSDAQVIIPIEQLEGMTDLEIGETVRELVEQAMQLSAEEDAYYYIRSGSYETYSVDRATELRGKLVPFADKSENIREALAKLDADENEFLLREAGRKSKKAKRSQVASNHDRLFLAVGKRDGFRCAQCGGVEDLVIDHIMPLDLNGSNDLDNLQLLCRAHNSQKGATYVDYRGK